MRPVELCSSRPVDASHHARTCTVRRRSASASLACQGCVKRTHIDLIGCVTSKGIVTLGLQVNFRTSTISKVEMVGNLRCQLYIDVNGTALDRLG